MKAVFLVGWFYAIVRTLTPPPPPNKIENKNARNGPGHLDLEDKGAIENIFQTFVDLVHARKSLVHGSTLDTGTNQLQISSKSAHGAEVTTPLTNGDETENEQF